MCGRYAFSTPPAEVAAHFGLSECADFGPRYNIPPGTDIPVIRLSPEGKRVLHLLRWGLIPHWSKDPSIDTKLNNARAEGVREKPSFRDAFRHRRCLIPVDGFYEWKAEGRRLAPSGLHAWPGYRETASGATSSQIACASPGYDCLRGATLAHHPLMVGHGLS